MTEKNEAKKEILCCTDKPIKTAWDAVKEDVLRVGLGMYGAGYLTLSTFRSIYNQHYAWSACFISFGLLSVGVVLGGVRGLTKKLSKLPAPKLENPTP